MTISPSPQRYFRLRRVLSARSSRQTGGSRSNRAAQFTLAFNSSISASCLLIAQFSFRDRLGGDDPRPTSRLSVDWAGQGGDRVFAQVAGPRASQLDLRRFGRGRGAARPDLDPDGTTEPP